MQEVVALRLIIRDGEYKFDRFEIFAVVWWAGVIVKQLPHLTSPYVDEELDMLRLWHCKKSITINHIK